MRRLCADSENETVRKFVMNPLHSYAVRVILAVVGEGGSSGSDEGNLSAIRNSLQGVRIGEFELSKLLSSSEQRQALADEQCLDNLLSLLVLAYREVRPELSKAHASLCGTSQLC